MNKNTTIFIILLALLALGATLFLNQRQQGPEVETPTNNDEIITNDNGLINTELGFELSYPDDFEELGPGDRDRLNSLGYIPPCTDDYLSCVYYTGAKLENTNLDSAGISVRSLDEVDAEACSSFADTFTLPETDILTEDIDGRTFYVAQSGDAGAGHIAEQSIYRTHQDNTCLEIVARIGYTQFANYPEGEIEELTENDRSSLMSAMKDSIRTLTFTDL